MASAANTSSANESLNALLPVYSHIEYPFTLERGEGMRVYDTAGKAYLDFYGGHCVCSIGHNPPAVVEAIVEQAKTLMFYSNLAPMEIKVKAASALVEFANNEFTSAFFCNSGGEANENALKIAVKASGRSKLVSFKGGFHGRTMLALTATHIPKWHEQYRPFIGKAEYITPNSRDELAAIDSETAAVILEPIQSIGGCTEFEADYLRALRERCDEVGALLIFDEVQTGIGRTGVPFVSGHFGAHPDMMTLAKGLAAGFPIGAVVMRANVAQQIEPGDIAATFGAGPLAMAAMTATLSEIKRLQLVAHAGKMEAVIRKEFSELPFVTRIGGRGLLLGIELDREAKPVQSELFKHGIIVGTNSNSRMLHLLPPLTVSEQDVSELKSAVQEVLQ